MVLEHVNKQVFMAFYYNYAYFEYDISLFKHSNIILAPFYKGGY
jgi:hypothetical protein